MNRRWIKILALLMTLVPVMGQAAPVRARLDDNGLQRVKIVAGSYFFQPDHIIVKVGVPVVLEVDTEAGIIPHSLVIWSPRMGIDVNERLATTSIIRFTPRATGQVPFYCEEKLIFFRSHQDRGMTGVLQVVE
ncbi:plastocyanin domain-containing protein [Oceanisphaera litoralis]|uniref:cupredoxin domain-containing protein n=1 Tax=Oceanisphaera litoralis TaxID=225144 RepID=UPI0019587C79|nr:quinol oxidase [Oceanisphaera litoralis]MBM7457217.1 plastocyanin domain-containing protein [Oceanisphaera litoralis]